MSFPAAHEPAFIVNSKLGADASYMAKAAPSNPYLSSSPDSQSTTGSLSPRSTSTGSASEFLNRMPSMAEAETDCTGLPEFDYPAPLFIRNTFIDGGVMRPLSLDEFLEERRVHSCPVESLPAFGSEYDVQAGNSVMDSALAAAASASAAMAAATRCWMRPFIPGQPPVHPPLLPSAQGFGALTTPVTPPPPGLESPILRLSEAIAEAEPAEPSQMPLSPILSLADAIAEPELGTPEFPTIGSAGHRIGTWEKKRRQKEKGVFMRDIRRIGIWPEA